MALRPSVLVLISLGVCLPRPHPHGSGLCPSKNITLQEGSSQILAHNIATYSNILYLCKRNESTFEWNNILSISKDHVNFAEPEYKNYFHISSNSLAVTNASGLLNGYYQVVYYLNSTCLHQFFLEIVGSKGTSPWIWIVLIIAAVILMVPCCWWLRSRRRSDGNKQFQSIPRNENGSPLCLPNGIQMSNLEHVDETTKTPL